MADILDVLFRFPPDKGSGQVFVERVLNLLGVVAVVVDSKLRIQTMNLRYTERVGELVAKMKGQTRRRNLKAFSALIRPHVTHCLKTGTAQIVPRTELPGSPGVCFDLVICPGEIQGVEVAFVLGLPPGSVSEAGKDGAADYLLERFDGAVLFLDCSLRYRKFNRHFLDVFDLGEVELVGKCGFRR
ncbi:MAG: hypothetical protein V1694_01430 [Candidatus Eisenbacteria bacterium]